jgi:hypothetical protein
MGTVLENDACRAFATHRLLGLAENERTIGAEPGSGGDGFVSPAVRTRHLSRKGS